MIILGYDITIHREINRSIINFSSEQLLNVFYGIVKRYNKLENFELLRLKKIELWEMIGRDKNSYISTEINNLIDLLTQSGTFKIKQNIKLSGSIFIIRQEDEDLTIEIPQLYQKYIYNRTDIKNIINLETIKSVEENFKTKENILLLKQADILKIKGKYNKRLYSLLMASKKNSKGLYKENYTKFKEVLGIKPTYQEGTINKRILNLDNKELSKVGIKLLNIEKKRNEILIKFSYKEVKKKNIEKEILKKIEEQKKKRKEEEQEKAERKEREKQELKELKKYLTKSEEEVFAFRYRDNKYIKKDVVTFDMYLEILIETEAELKEKLKKRRNEVKPISPSV